MLRQSAKKHPIFQKAAARYHAAVTAGKKDLLRQVGLLAPPSGPFPDLSSLLLPYRNEPTVVFYNGVFIRELSGIGRYGEEVVCEPLERAFFDYESFLTDYFDSYLEGEEDPEPLLSLALSDRGAFLYFPENFRSEKPLKIIEIEDGAEGYTSPFVVLCSGRKASIFIETVSIRSKEFTGQVNGCRHFILEEGASLDCRQRDFSLPGRSFSAHRYFLKKESRLKVLRASFGAEEERTDDRVIFSGENAVADLSGLWTLRDNGKMSVRVRMEHRAPRCISSQLFKGVLKDSSSSEFDGKIYISPEASQTDAYQLNRHCLFSDRARARSRPNLEIFADDVKASHGSSTGLIDSEMLFYLRARGISVREAEKLLVKAFFEDVFSKIEDPEWHGAVSKMLSESMDV